MRNSSVFQKHMYFLATKYFSRWRIMENQHYSHRLEIMCVRVQIVLCLNNSRDDCLYKEHPPRMGEQEKNRMFFVNVF